MELLWLHFIPFVKNFQNPVPTWNACSLCVASVAPLSVHEMFERAKVILSTAESKRGDFSKTGGEDLADVFEGCNLLLVEL